MFRRKRKEAEEVAKVWEEIATSWERLADKAHAEALQARSLLLAAAITTDNPALTKYSTLLRELFIAADAIYITPKVGSVTLTDPYEMMLVNKLMSTIRELDTQLVKDGLRGIDSSKG